MGPQTPTETPVTGITGPAGIEPFVSDFGEDVDIDQGFVDTTPEPEPTFTPTPRAPDFVTGDAQIAEETIGTLPEITEARQKQGEQIQEIQQQEVVQSGSDEADKQQKDTGVA